MQTKTPEKVSPIDFPRSIGCRCKEFNQTKRTCEDIKKLIQEKLDGKMMETPAATATAVNISEAPEMVINYTYTDMGRQMMILDISAPMSVAGIAWMTQYLKEFGRTIEEMKLTKCLQSFVFGPSRKYISQTMVKLPVLVTRLDGREDVLVIQTYLVDAEIPFLCGKQTLDNWNFKIDGREKILEIQSKIEGLKMKIRMIDTSA